MNTLRNLQTTVAPLRFVLLLAALVAALALAAGFPHPAQAAPDIPHNCGLIVEIIAAPYAAVDSNKPGVEGPQVATLGARIRNTSSLAIKDVSVGFSSPALGMLNGGGRTYFLNDLLPGASVTAYWPVTYPPTYNVSYPYTITVTTPSGCSASSSSELTTQSEIGATANKLQPTGGTVTVTPAAATLGSMVTVRITGFTLGTVGQGPKGTYDAWLQPLGNRDFDPSCLRLVRSEARLGSLTTTPYIDQLYFTGLRNYTANPADYVAYTFIALRPCSTNIRPYQEAASGTQEKYNADYSALTSRVGMTSTTSTALQINVQGDRTQVKAGDAINYVATYTATEATVGYPANGNPLVIYAPIPPQTGYLGGSATETAQADAEFSRDGGGTWGTQEPTDPNEVTDVRWVINEPVDGKPRQVQVGVTVDGGYNGSPIVMDVSGALYDGPVLTAGTSKVTAAAANNTPQANDDSVRTTAEVAVTFSVLDNDNDADGNLQLSTAAATSAPRHGVLTAGGSGVFTYTPAAGYTGSDDFTYQVCDDQGACDAAAVVIYTGEEQYEWRTNTTYVAFEDLKHAGWVDWDYNDFVVKIDTRTAVDARGRVRAIEVDYDALARGAGYAARFVHDLPIEGGGTAQVAVYGSDGALLSQRTFAFEGNTNFTIFDRTVDALPPLPGFFDTNTRATQSGTVMGRKAKLLVYPAQPDANLALALPPPPWDPYIYVYFTRQEVHLPVPGHMDNTQVVNPTRDLSGPLVGYDLPLAQAFAAGWRWPEEFRGIWQAFPQFAAYIGAGGATATDWWQPQNAVAQYLWSPGVQAAAAAVPGVGLELGGAGADGEGAATAAAAGSGARYFGGPVAADLDGDGWTEIIVGSLLANRVEVFNVLGGAVGSWPQAVNGGVKAPPAVADLDGDGQLEILAGTEAGELYAWKHNGQRLGGWPVVLNGGFRILATPAVGDLDGDGSMEVIVPAADGKLYVLDAAGAGKSGWPASIGDVEDRYGSQVINSSPRLADLDGDGTTEVVIGSTDKRIYVFNHDGTPRWVFPTDDMVLGTPAVGEIDPSVGGLEIAVGSGDRYLYLLDADGNLLWRRPTGWTLRSSPLLADLDGNGDVEILAGSDDDRVWAWHHDGTLVGGWPQTVGADVLAAVQVGDLDGDGSPEVVAGADDAQVWAWHHDGTSVAGWPKPMTMSVKGAPLLANLDDDAQVEVTAADLGGEIRKWNVDHVSYTVPVYLPAVTRGR